MQIFVYHIQRTGDMQFFAIDGSIRWIFLFHALLGSLALAVFLVPLLAKKGSQLHIKSGWIFVWAMTCVSASALVITIWRSLFDEASSVDARAFALFLAFIAILTLNALWSGLTVLNSKDRKSPSRAIRHIGLPILLMSAAAIVELVGIKLQKPLLIIFPVLGFKLGLQDLRYWLSSPKAKMHWWYAHMHGMFTACIATITAFLVTALPRIWPSPLSNSVLLWVAPGILLGFILNRWTNFYLIRFKEIN